MHAHISSHFYKCLRKALSRMAQNAGNPVPQSRLRWLTEALQASPAAQPGSSLKEKMPLLKVAVGVDENN